MSKPDDYVRCGCGDAYPPNSYGAGFMAANNGVCENCGMYDSHIPISTKTGQRFAKAEAEYARLVSESYNQPDKEIDYQHAAACHEEFMRAAHELGRELVANGHHEVEGD